MPIFEILWKFLPWNLLFLAILAISKWQLKSADFQSRISWLPVQNQLKNVGQFMDILEIFATKSGIFGHFSHSKMAEKWSKSADFRSKSANFWSKISWSMKNVGQFTDFCHENLCCLYCKHFKTALGSLSD